MNEVCRLAGSKAAHARIAGAFPLDGKGYLTVGLAFRKPRTYKKPMSVRELLDFINENNCYWYDIYADEGNNLHVSAFDANDMF